MTTAALLAHQGGWDEILLVVGPLALVAALLWLANRRITDQLTATETENGENSQSGEMEDHGQVEGSSSNDPPS